MRLDFTCNAGQDVHVSVSTTNVLAYVWLALHLLGVVAVHRSHGLHCRVGCRVRTRACVTGRCDSINHNRSSHCKRGVNALGAELLHLLHSVAPDRDGSGGTRAHVALQNRRADINLLCLHELHLTALQCRQEMLSGNVQLAAARRQTQVLPNVRWLAVQPTADLGPLNLARGGDDSDCVANLDVFHRLGALGSQGIGACRETEEAHGDRGRENGGKNEEKTDKSVNVNWDRAVGKRVEESLL